MGMTMPDVDTKVLAARAFVDGTGLHLAIYCEVTSTGRCGGRGTQQLTPRTHARTYSSS